MEGQPAAPRRENLHPRCLRTYGHDYKVIFVGDATMSPYEIMQAGGSIEHWNEEAGITLDANDCCERGRVTCGSIRSRVSDGSTLHPCKSRAKPIEDRMFPLTLGGLDEAIKALH